MNLEDDVVYAWKEYTAAEKNDAGPVSTIDVDDTVIGGLASFSDDSMSCCLKSWAAC